MIALQATQVAERAVAAESIRAETGGALGARSASSAHCFLNADVARAESARTIRVHLADFSRSASRTSPAAAVHVRFISIRYRIGAGGRGAEAVCADSAGANAPRCAGTSGRAVGVHTQTAAMQVELLEHLCRTCRSYWVGIEVGFATIKRFLSQSANG